MNLRVKGASAPIFGYAAARSATNWQKLMILYALHGMERAGQGGAHAPPEEPDPAWRFRVRPGRRPRV